MREAGLQRGDSWRKPRRIYDHEFLYCFTGSAHACVDGAYRRVTEGDVIVIPPDTPHTLWLESASEGDLYWFHCDFTYFGDGDWVYAYYNTPENYARTFSGPLAHPEHIRPRPVLDGGYRLPAFITLEHGDDVELIFRGLYKSFTRADGRFALTGKQLFLRLLEQLLTVTGYFDEPERAHSRVSNRIKRYVSGNYAAKMTVAEICACTGLHPDYAAKLFRRETGMTLVNYVNAFRMEKAKRFLLHEELSIAAVAERVGFQNENYFSVVSRHVTGMTPARLRQYMISLMESTE